MQNQVFKTKGKNATFSKYGNGQFGQVIEERQNLKIGCIEEVAYRMGYINKAQLHEIAKPLAKSGYGEYLMKL